MTCAWSGCANLVPKAVTGRPGHYCSAACKQQAYRARRRVTKAAAAPVTKQPDILFYCGLNERYWNHHTVEPGAYVCIAPFTSRQDKTGTKRLLSKTNVLIDETRVNHIMVDSCAFSERIEVQGGVIVKNERLSFNDALQRQIAHAYEFRYAHLVEAIVSYDLLIDETWVDGVRSKQRWSVEAAEFAVTETISAAQYLASQRQRIDHTFGHPVHLVLSAQGVNTEQYARCAAEIVKVMRPDDIFGLGGWCIAGLLRHAMLPAAAEILPRVFEVLGRAGVKRVHVFGVILPALLGFLLYLCDRSGLHLSTDSAGPCVEPARNASWGYGSWSNPKYKPAKVLASCRTLDAAGNKAPTCIPETFCTGMERIRHVTLTRDYLAHFREREPQLVKALPVSSTRQLALFAEEVA